MSIQRRKVVSADFDADELGLDPEQDDRKWREWMYCPYCGEPAEDCICEEEE